MPNSGLVNDACGICGGDGSTCAGCDNVPNSGLVNDACGVCDGDNHCLTSNEGVQVWVIIIVFAVFLLVVIFVVLLHVSCNNTKETTTTGTVFLKYTDAFEKTKSRTSLQF